jgi:hypothetical protein
MVNYEELLKSKDAEIEMLRNICATLKTALNMELKFQRNNAKSFAEFKAPLLKKEEPIKIHVEVKPKTSDEIFAERLARAMAFRQTMDNAEKDLQMKSQMQTVKQMLELSKVLKQQDLLKVETEDRKEFVKSRAKSNLFKCSSESKLYIALKKEISRRKSGIKIVANHEDELPQPTQNLRANAVELQLWNNREKFAKAIAETNIAYKSKLAIALNEEIVRREFYKSVNYSSVSYFARKTSFPTLF